MPREHRRLHRDFLRPAGVEEAADLRVLAFGILAHDDEVDVAALPAGERARHAGVQHRGPHAGVLIEPAPDRQQEPVERHVVLQARIADRAEEDRVERAQPVERVLRHHPAVREVVLRPPGKMLPREAKSEPLRRRFQRPDRRRNHLAPDPVAGDDRHPIRFHRLLRSRHHRPIAFHQRKPIGSQIARCSSEIRNPIRHHRPCVT